MTQELDQEAALELAKTPCDRCGWWSKAQASKGADLLSLCGHHFRKALPGLQAQGWVLVDPNNEAEYGPIVSKLIGDDHA
jgi:hypothetical protein